MALGLYTRAQGPDTGHNNECSNETCDPCCHTDDHVSPAGDVGEHGAVGRGGGSAREAGEEDDHREGSLGAGNSGHAGNGHTVWGVSPRRVDLQVVVQLPP